MMFSFKLSFNVTSLYLSAPTGHRYQSHHSALGSGASPSDLRLSHRLHVVTEVINR